MATPEYSNRQTEINASDRLGLTLFLALAIHAIIVFGVGFTRAELPDAESLSNLDVILANSRSLETVENPDFLAQVDQLGGGESEEKARPGAPVSANTPFDQGGLADQVRTESKNNSPPLKQIFLIGQTEELEMHIPPPQPEYRQSQIAQLQAEIRQMKIDYAKRPRIVTLTASTKKSVEAGYLAAWVEKIENTGNVNYPAEVRRKKLSGQLRMRVHLDATGKLLDYKITESSGSQVLDQAAKRILRLAAPFPPFPEAMKKQADHVVIIRTWSFKTNQLRTDGHA